MCSWIFINQETPPGSQKKLEAGVNWMETIRNERENDNNFII